MSYFWEGFNIISSKISVDCIHNIDETDCIFALARIVQSALYHIPCVCMLSVYVQDVTEKIRHLCERGRRDRGL